MLALLHYHRCTMCVVVTIVQSVVTVVVYVFLKYYCICHLYFSFIFFNSLMLVLFTVVNICILLIDLMNYLNRLSSIIQIIVNTHANASLYSIPLSINNTFRFAR